MSNEKAAQRNQLIYEFGILIQPLEEISKASTTPTLADYRIAVAKVQSGDPTWRQSVKAYTTFAPDIIFNGEYQEISHVPERCWQKIKGLLNDTSLQNNLSLLKDQFREQVEFSKRSFFQIIEHIPIEWEPVVFQANTPFTSYLKIKEAFSTVKTRIDYFDRYLKPDFYQLFLAAVERSIAIRLVTTLGDQNYGVSAVSSISRLAAQEFTTFQLIQVNPSNLHDRNLRIDDQNFTLGPGVDRAGLALTNFGPTESTTEAHSELDRIISGGTVVV